MPTDYEYAKLEFEKWFAEKSRLFAFDPATDEGRWTKGMMFEGFLAGFNKALDLVEERFAKRGL